MIKSNQFIEINIMPQNYEHYKKLGYSPQIRKKLIVKAEDIPFTSKTKIKYICDYCGEEFERTIGSNSRNKTKDNNKDACSKCTRIKSKETCINRYNVENVMQVKEYKNKCLEYKRNDLFNSNYPTSYIFKNGIPVSLAQNNLYELLKDYELNYKFYEYYLDLFNQKENIAIEYNGKGHDLQVRLNKITIEKFQEKEEKRKDKILKNNIRLLIIQDKKNLWKEKSKIDLKEILEFIKSDQFYKEIIIS
jgi:hypothetical protein